MRTLPARPRPVARVLPLTEPSSPPSRAASGWFRNIFDAKLVLDPTLYTLVADPHYNIEVKHFDGRGAISGKLVVAAPEGRTVDHEGIEISFSTIVDNKADMQSTRGPAMLKTWTLLEPGEVTGAIEIPFDIDLTQIPQLRDSYDGEHIALRHVLSYRIVRPWYTFSVRGEEVVSVGLSHLPARAEPLATCRARRRRSKKPTPVVRGVRRCAARQSQRRRPPSQKSNRTASSSRPVVFLKAPV